MKIRGLTIATVVLAALAGTLYWSNRHKPDETTQASADTPPKILTLKEGDITKVMGGATDKPLPSAPKKIEPKGGTQGPGSSMSSLLAAKRRAQEQMKKKEEE